MHHGRWKIKSLKFVGIFSAFGFLLSFVCGLCSGSRIGHLFLTALIFAVVFAALGFGISVLYEKFLAVEGSQGGSDFSAPSADSKKNHTVDIVIQDEELPSEDNAGQYYVGSNHFMLNPEDLGKKPAPKSQAQSRPSPQPAFTGSAEAVINENKSAAVKEAADVKAAGNVQASAAPSDSGFVPIRNLETLYNASGKEAVAKNEVSSAASAALSVSGGDELDSLPDLDNVSLFDTEIPSSHYSADEINNDSDFATGGVRNKNVEQPEVKDAELMAKAISSILSNES